MYTPFSIKWLDQQTQTSQRWQMGSISLYMFCPLEPQKSCECFWRNIGVWGEGKVEKDGETAGARKRSDAHRRTVFTFRVVRNVKGCITLPHTENILSETAAVSGGRFWGPHHRQDSKSSGTPTASKQSLRTGAAGRQYSSDSHRNTPSHVPLSCRQH